MNDILDKDWNENQSVDYSKDYNETDGMRLLSLSSLPVLRSKKK